MKTEFKVADKKVRCGWCLSGELMVKYHDEEWGNPVHDDKKLFEFLLLDAFQAGLSWSTIINKRKNFKKAFDNFNYKKIAKYDSKKINELLNDEGIIRNKLKIYSSVENAKLFIEIQKEFGSFDKYIWQFTGGKTIHNNRKSMKDIPAVSAESDAMSKDLKKRGFNFVGSTICYAFMQAAGMVNDHIENCFRFKAVKKLK
ncbi:MAG TPA: DNA-3-methyladenine glycosylase I [Ignavibacteria bacterium]|nr:DNA-3-methyladenine glycosylase I [Bacteroidota bacterium]HRI84364.1 DNA-3-methyladenine glycosylase I [Ignavibacteria bacterium]HRJ99335.1 DNA-3-methyladenine glycosylase I [Ignavibacteria bacterium]